MTSLLDEALIGLGMAIVIEGLLYAGFPGVVRRMAREALNLPEQTLRNFGVIAMFIGIALIWLVRRI